MQTTMDRLVFAAALIEVAIMQITNEAQARMSGDPHALLTVHELRLVVMALADIREQLTESAR